MLREFNLHMGVAAVTWTLNIGGGFTVLSAFGMNIEFIPPGIATHGCAKVD